jgi:uncharacterized protein
MKSKKVILDTNLWISFLISRDFSFLDNYIETGKIRLIFSEELFSEFILVTERPKFKKYFAESDIKHLIRIIDRFGILVQVTTEINRCRDIKDNFLLSLAIDSSADYLVTGDNDLIELEHINKTKIITIQGLRDALK